MYMSTINKEIIIIIIIISTIVCYGRTVTDAQKNHFEINVIGTTETTRYYIHI